MLEPQFSLNAVAVVVMPVGPMNVTPSKPATLLYCHL
jgi:hypothetical protein